MEDESRVYLESPSLALTFGAFAPGILPLLQRAIDSEGRYVSVLSDITVNYVKLEGGAFFCEISVL